MGTAGLPGLNLPVLTRDAGERLHEPLTDLIRVLGWAETSLKLSLHQHNQMWQLTVDLFLSH